MDEETNFIDLTSSAEEPLVPVSSGTSGGSIVRSNVASATNCIPTAHHHVAATNSTGQSGITGPETSPSGRMSNSPSMLPLASHIPNLCMVPPIQPVTPGYDPLPFHTSHTLPGNHQPFVSPFQLANAACPLPLRIHDLQSVGLERESSTFDGRHSNPILRTRKRSRNWEPWEILLLIQAKKLVFERYWGHPGRDRLENSAQKYKRVVDYLRQHRVTDRDAAACKNKWEAISAEYRLIKDWERKAGNPPYSSMGFQERKLNNLPSSFETEAQELMDTFQSKHNVSPSTAVDSLLRQTASAETSSVAPAGTEALSLSAGDGGEDEEREQMVPHEDPELLELWASGKRKKTSGNVVSAFQELSQSILRIEKDRAERAREANEMAKDAHLLEVRKFEFLQRKMEREDKRAEKFVGVLGSIAGAFHKMAEKM